MSESVRIEIDAPRNGMHRTQGTRVFVGDVEVTRVTGITLRADVDGVWRATIECIPQLPDHIVAEYARDVTTLGSNDREYEWVKPNRRADG